MTRKSYVQINGELIDKSDDEAMRRAYGEAGRSGPMIVADLPDFVSPIDGKSYSGRAGLREHCRIHNVVPNVELKGLPTYTSQSDTRSAGERRSDAAARKQQIINLVNNHR